MPSIWMRNARHGPTSAEGLHESGLRDNSVYEGDQGRDDQLRIELRRFQAGVDLLMQQGFNIGNIPGDGCTAAGRAAMDRCYAVRLDAEWSRGVR